MLAFLRFIILSIRIVSDTNKANFAYTISIRDTIEEIDRIVERAEVNLNTLANTINVIYDLNHKYNENYNLIFTDRLNPLIKSVLINSPGVDSVWFQIDANLPFSDHIYNWYKFENNNYVNLQKKYNEHRQITPEDDSYYFKAIKTKKLIWTDIYQDYDSKIKTMSLAQPVYKSNQLIGVVGIDISVENLHQALKNMQEKFKGTEIFLLNSEGKLLIAQFLPDEKDTNDVEQFLPIFKKLYAEDKDNSEKIIEYNDNGIRKTAISLWLSNNYELVITFHNKEIYKGFNRLFITIYIIFTIMIGMGLVALVNKRKLMRTNFNLELEKNKLRTILDASPNIIMLKDLNGIYIDCNKRCLDAFKLTKEEFCGKTDYDFFNEEEIKEILENDRIVLETKKTLIKEGCYILDNSNKVCLEKYIVPIFNIHGEIVNLFILGIDITKRKEGEAFLQNAKETAEKTAEMKSNFLANMSHEIRTPLNGVIGFIQLLSETKTTKEQAEFIEDALMSSEMLLNIINEILDFSKIEAEKLNIDEVSFDVRNIVEDITLIATTTAEKKGVEVNALICSDIPEKVIGDPVRIKQILNNLVNNAVKFTKEGEIVIHVKQLWEDSDNSVLSFKVRDTGIGIEQDKLNQIFEAFNQADNSMTRRFGGTGLGLAISKRLAELMNGSINVESKVGEGSTFTFIVPCSKDKTITSEDNNNINQLQGIKILAVDKNTTDLKIIHYYLNEMNCIIYEAHSAQEALDILNNDTFSVILIDYNVQNINDKRLSTILRENDSYKNIPLILSKPLTKKSDYDDSQEAEFNSIIHKPIKKQDLIESIINVISTQNDTLQNQFIESELVLNTRFSPEAKILVVEDSELNQKLVLKILEKHGLKADIANNGQEAIDAFKFKKYDLIFMDCQMPILNGYDATKQIREIENESKNLHTPIIAMTANALAKDEIKCYEIGMDAYISKPVNVNELLNIIKKYINLVKETAVAAAETDYVKCENIHDYIEKIICEITQELGFSIEEAVNFLDEFIKYLPQALTEFDKTLQDNDFEQLKKDAHKLKGSSSTLRINDLTQLILELEYNASKFDKENCERLLGLIETQIENLTSLFFKFNDK